MSSILDEENAIVIASATKMVELGSLCGQNNVDGEESDENYEEGKKLFKLLKAYRKKDDLEENELSALLYCLRDLSDEDSFPTVSPLVGQELLIQEITVEAESAIAAEAELREAGDAAEATARNIADLAIIAYAESLVVGLWDDRGNFDASVNAYPSSGGSGTAGAILKGDVWTVSVAGTLPTGRVVEIGDIVRALVDTPGNTEANWAIQQNNIGYTAENSANKTTTVGGNETSETLYPNIKALVDYITATVINTGSDFGGNL